jgi:acyl-CoA dehydrogenase
VAGHAGVDQFALAMQTWVRMPGSLASMAWDFETDPEFQKKLDWIEEFMEEEVEPLSHLGMAPDGAAGRAKFIKPLQDKVKAEGLWACHLGPELGGQGYGQVKLALMNEKLGRVGLAPVVFGCQAPDTGNAEIIAHYGTDRAEGKVAAGRC